jgi:uncharacterized protein (TIGR03437 family)
VRPGAIFLLGLAPAGLWAQPASDSTVFLSDWRRIGNSAIDLSLAGVAGGAVERVWYSAAGALLVRTATGQTFATSDFETWTAVEVEPPAASEDAPALAKPESSVRLAAYAGSPHRLYAAGKHAWRSDDGGANWANLTAYRQDSILGNGLSEIAVSPRDPDDIVAAGRFGLWRSLDGGASWTGLNESLPNLPVRRILGVPRGMQGMRVFVDQAGASGLEIEWRPGERHAWRPSRESELARETILRAALSAALRADVSAVAEANGYIYAGTTDGRIWASADQGRNWQPPSDPAGAPVERIFVDAREPRFALAALGARRDDAGSRIPAHVLRTINGGLGWDDITSDLGDVAVNSVVAERASGVIYAATARGVYLTFTNLMAAGPATPWTRLGGNLYEAAVTDVRLDDAGNQLYVAIAGHGILATAAPHRFRDPRVVSAADYAVRPAAPGTLLTVLGGRIRAARAGTQSFPVLDASGSESQIQVPFDVTEAPLSLALEAAVGRFTLPLPVESVSPAVFVDPDGSPFVLDADTGLRIDTMNPARSGARIQLLATGLGKVQPEWPAGLAAPLENPPRVVAPVRVLLDRTPVSVSRSVLAPGYIGYYLVEVQLPEIVNAGPAELYVEAGPRQSNRVSIHLEP